MSAGDLSKNMFFCQKNMFLEGVHLGQKKPLFVVKKLFCVSTRFYSLDGMTSGRKKPLFVVKKFFFRVHGYPLVWKVSILVKKNIYF